MYRLPSEAEWEFATRAGTAGASYWAETQAESDESACCHANLMDQVNAGRWVGRPFPCDDGHTYSAAVDDPRFKPNAFGLHHVISNVSEWVQDCWHPSYDDAPADGSVWSGGDGSRGVVRGGDYMYGQQVGVGSHLRSWQLASAPYPHTGFRVARTLDRP